MTQLSTRTYGDRHLIIATGNPGKRREFATLLREFVSPDWEIYDRSSFPTALPEVEENSSTFQGNAVKKAMETAAATGCCALADDSGLEVDALGGAPGVMSARFAGENATDEENNRLLLEKLKGVPERERAARFVAVICLAMPENRVGRAILAKRGRTRDEIEPAAPRTEGELVKVEDQILVWFRATVEGRVSLEPKGEGGFGYDPHFFVPQWGKCMAEVTMEQKNRISHRASAVRKLVDFFSVPNPG